MFVDRWQQKVLDEGITRKIYYCQKPGTLHPVANATIKVLTYFCLCGLWPKIQATRFTGGR